MLRRRPTGRRRADRPAAAHAPRLVYGVTVGTTARVLLAGQLAWFRERGWDVHLVCSPGPEATEAAHREGVTLHELPMSRAISPAADLKALVEWVVLLRRLRPEVVHVGTPKAGLLGTAAARLAGVPRRVYTVHGLRFEGSTGLQRTILEKMELVSTLSATDVVVVSPSVGKGLEGIGVDPAKLRLPGAGSCNGVDVAKVAERAARRTRAEVLAPIGQQDAPFTVGFIGRITPDKGVAHLVAALNSLADEGLVVPLVCVGAADEGQDESVLDDTRFPIARIGWSDDPHSYLSSMDVLLLPTRREGLPTVVLEAAAVGIPTITTDVTGARDAVVDGRTGLLVPFADPVALAAAIRRLAQDPQLRERLGRQAAERVRERFRPEQVWAALAEIVEGTPGPAGPVTPPAVTPAVAARRAPAPGDAKVPAGV